MSVWEWEEGEGEMCIRDMSVSCEPEPVPDVLRVGGKTVRGMNCFAVGAVTHHDEQEEAALGATRNMYCPVPGIAIARK